MARVPPWQYIMIKPDGVQRGLVGDIIKRFEQRGYQLKALKLYQASEELLRQHYCDLVEKKFFPSLLGYMLSGPVTCMVWCVRRSGYTHRDHLGLRELSASVCRCVACGAGRARTR